MFVILVVKDLQLFFPAAMKDGEATRTDLRHGAGNGPKGNCRSFVAALLRRTNR
jgi:hypothetical protein